MAMLETGNWILDKDEQRYWILHNGRRMTDDERFG
jgi:hypothetical protein